MHCHLFLCLRNKVCNFSHFFLILVILSHFQQQYFNLVLLQHTYDEANGSKLSLLAVFSLSYFERNSVQLLLQIAVTSTSYDGMSKRPSVRVSDIVPEISLGLPRSISEGHIRIKFPSVIVVDLSSSFLDVFFLLVANCHIKWSCKFRYYIFRFSCYSNFRQFQ